MVVPPAPDHLAARLAALDQDPQGALRVRRAMLLATRFGDYPVLRGLRYRAWDRAQQCYRTKSAFHQILPDDVPAALLAYVAGLRDWLPLGLMRLLPAATDDDRVRLEPLHEEHRLYVVPEVLATGLTRCGAYDFDGRGHSEPLRDPLGTALAVYDGLQARGVPAHLVRSNSGQGYHLWVFWTAWTSAAEVRHVLTALLREAVTDEEWCKVEVNPKGHTDAARRGFPIALPWRFHSAPGCNELLVPHLGATRDLPSGGDFAEVTPEQMAALLAEFPAPVMPPAPPPRPRVAPARHGAAPAVPAPDTDTWYDRIKADRRLIEFTYGPYLTDTLRGDWWTCHDPFSPTGDRDPSAGVNMHSGAFHSFRTHTSSDILAMLVRLGKAATRAAACEIAETVTGIPRASHAADRHPYGAKIVADDGARPPAPEPLLLEEARAAIGQLVADEIAPLARRRGQGVYLIKAGTGAGKSHGLLQFCRGVVQGTIVGEDGRPLRVVWMTHSRAKTAEVLGDPLLRGTDGHPLPGIMRVHPRSRKESDPGYCARFEAATALATHRQSVTQTLCAACRREAKAEADAVWTTLTPTEQRAVRRRDLVTPCPYTEQLARLEDPDVRLIIGTRQSFQHGGSRLAEVDLVVVDEEADALFLHAFDLAMGDLATWEHRQHRDEALWQDLAPVLSVLKRALVTGPADGVITATRETPLLPVLRALDAQFDDHLRALAAQVRARPPWERGFAIDVPTETEVWEGREPIPTRALTDLVETLALEAQPGGALRDTRVWLCPQSGQAPGRLRCWVSRDALVESLCARTTVFLDATAHVPTLQRIFGGQVQVHAWPLKPYTQVTFFGDALYRQQDLARGGWRKPALLHALARLCHQHAKPLVVCPMGLEDELRQHLPAHAVLTHWYAGDMAGANSYEDCDAIILIGHPRPPESVVVQQVQALRWSETLARQAQAAEHPDGWATAEYTVPVEGFIDANGRAWARLVTYAQDSEIRDLARHRYSAAPHQAIGRLRPANPRPTLLPVYLFCGEPPQDLQIDTLTTLEAWLREHDPAYLREHPYPRLRSAAPSPQRDAKRLALQAERLDRYVAAAIRLQEAGLPISAYRLQCEVGGSCATASAYLARVLEVVAVRGARRQALLAAFRHILAHWHMPALWTATHGDARPGALAYWERLSEAQVERIWLRKRFDARDDPWAAPDPANAARARALFAEDEARWLALCADWTWLEPADPETDPPPTMTREEWEEQEFGVWWHDLSLPEATAMACVALGMLADVAEPRDGDDMEWTPP